MSSITINENPAARGLLAWRARADWWVSPAAIGVIALAAVVYLWNLTVSGFANTYYSMAAQAASQSWSAWFWGSLDAGNFITVDKPPLATMAMGLSVRLFGLSSGAILLPEAIFGVATVALLYAIVRRPLGPIAATLAALVAAITPAAVLMFRYNNPDALLTLLLVGAAGALLRALENGRLRWVVLSAVLVGLGFNTKFLQAYLVLPAFALVYLIAARGGLLRRLGHLVVAAMTVVLASGWWVAAVELTPAASRPFIGGSTDNSAIQLLLGYDGLERVLGWFGFDGATTTAVPGLDGGGGIFGGVPGLLRMFNTEFGGQIAWLLPAALVGLVVGLIARRGTPRTDLQRAAYLLWGGWLVVHAAVFSFMSGIVHSYYSVAMVPAIGALVGAGAAELWSAKARGGRIGSAAAITLGATVAGTAFLAAVLLWRAPEFMPWLAPVVAAGGLVAGVALAVPNLPRRAVAVAGAMGLAVVLAGPIAYSIGTVNAPHTGGDPQAGPFLVNTSAGPGSGGPVRGFGGPDGVGGPGSIDGWPPVGGFGQSRELTQQLMDYLVANKGDATWVVAVRSANEAAEVQLATGQPVMAMGGFSGTDQALSLPELESDVASGRLRYILIESAAPPFGPSDDGLARSDLVNWVTEHGRVVSEVGGGALYDVSGVK